MLLLSPCPVVQAAEWRQVDGRWEGNPVNDGHNTDLFKSLQRRHAKESITKQVGANS